MSRDYRGKKIVIYPEYIDSRKRRSEGRRIPLNLAVSHPTLKDIVRAAEKLGLNPIVEEDKSYPRSWHEHRGRVIVDKVDSKQKVLRMIAEEMKKT